MVSSHGVVFLKAMQGERINIRAFWVAALYRAPPARLITAVFVKDLKRTICIKNLLLCYELEQFQAGFHGGCAAVWPLEELVAALASQGSRMRKAIRWGGVGVRAKEVTVAAAIIQPNSSASKAGEARSKWLFYQWCVKQPEKRDESQSLFQSIGQRQGCSGQVRRHRNG